MRTTPIARGLAFLLLGLVLTGCGRQDSGPTPEPAAPESAGTPTLDSATGGLTNGTPPVANRGTFGEGSCDSEERVAVDENAAYAIYYDESGEPVGTSAEDLTGTQAIKICPTPTASGPGACALGFCPRTISGRVWCLRC